MYDLLGTALWCITVYLVMHQLLTRLSALPKPLVEVRVSQAEAASADPLDSLPVPSDDIMAFCAQESEEYARDQLLRDAHLLYREHKDWSSVLAQLQRTNGEVA